MSGYLSTLIGNIVLEIVNPLIWLLIGAALVYFLWGAALFIQHADSDEERTKGKSRMMWGVIGLVVMMSAFGIMCGIAHTIDAPYDVMNKIPFC